jgi:hypothetical protein
MLSFASGGTVDKPANDASVLAHIQSLVEEEHRLFDHQRRTDEETRRLASLQTQLDKYWDLLRQRRALREFGDEPSKARARDASVVEKYIG